MSDKPLKRLAENGPLIGGVAGTLMRGLGKTLRFEIEDCSGMLSHGGHPGGVIWVAWHNRVVILPEFYRQHLFHRPGTVMTSDSRDGRVIAEVMATYEVRAVHGSSSKGGRQALLGAVRAIRQGRELVVTPDGPRGPRYELEPGLIKLAQITGAPLFLVGLRPRSSWRLEKSWDRLHIPRPFSTVDVELPPLEIIDPAAEVESERQRIEQRMIEINGGTD